jgi:uncharacterized paraquat-inducible protein A
MLFVYRYRSYAIALLLHTHFIPCVAIVTVKSLCVKIAFFFHVESSELEHVFNAVVLCEGGRWSSFTSL